MSPNKNYNAGRAFEYKRQAHYRELGYTVIRASGSHGPFDLIALRSDCVPLAIQCKRVSTRAEANRLLNKFEEAQPLKMSDHFQQVMEVYIKNDRQTLSVIV